MDAYATEVERVMNRLFDSLGEKDRRRYAAVEAAKLGHGGVEYIAGLFGCDPKTIRQGQAEVYETGRKCADGFKESMTIAFDKILPKWNYRAIPSKS
jgi:hypothetical protein